MKFFRDQLKVDVSTEFKNRVLNSVQAELSQLHEENKSLKWSRFQWLGFTTAAVLAWLGGHSLFEDDRGKDEFLEFADTDIIDDLDLLTSLENDDFDLLLDAEEGDV